MSDARAFARPLVKLVVFAVVTSLATLLLAGTIANSVDGDQISYRADFTDVTGLTEGDDVRVAGVRVGKVTDIEVHAKREARITFTVVKSRPLPTSVLAQIRYRNLVGTRYLALTEGSGSTEMMKENDVVPITQTTPSLDLTVLFGGFKPLFQALNPADLNRLSFEIIQVFQGEGGTIEDLLGHIGSLTGTLASRDKVIGNLITNLNTVLGTLSKRQDQFGDLIGQLQTFVTGLNQDKAAIFDSVASINTAAQQVTELLAASRPAIKQDLQQLTQLAGNLEAGGPILDQALKVLPNKIATITRTATYGSWFNFYLCTLTLPGQNAIDFGYERCK